MKPNHHAEETSNAADAAKFSLSNFLVGQSKDPLTPFDLLVSDIGLPDGSGIDLMERLNAEHSMVGIALTGYGMEDDIRKSRDAGFREHLVKPVDLNKLDAVIQEVAFSK
jgi:CheY-like chemotaxis protein